MKHAVGKARCAVKRSLPRALRVALSVVSVLTLAGCGGGRGFGRNAAEGVNILPIDYKADILAVAHSYINNPHAIRDAGISEPMLKTVGRGEHYIVCVRFDAANSDGKYTGSKARIAVFRRGKLDGFTEAETEAATKRPLEIFGAPESEDPCAGAVYRPFPELEKLGK